jgi:hypothetical protein
MKKNNMGLAAPRSDFTRTLQLYIRLRFECRTAFPEVWLLPGAWDVLLDMALAQQLNQPFRIIDAERAASSPPVIVLRTLKALLDAGMIAREMHGGYASFRVREGTLRRLKDLFTDDYLL